MEPRDDNLLLDGGPQEEPEDGSTADMAGQGQGAGSLALWSRERWRRSARRVAAAGAVLLLASLTLLLVRLLVPCRTGRQLPHCQDNTTFTGNTSDINTKQHQDIKIPRAMLTAPRNINLSKEYLEWESKDGHAFCIGFIYSNGHLVVPRNGIYRVFLQITYESVTECAMDELTLSNTVWSLTETYSNDVRLLSSFDTVSCSMEHWHKSLYSAGLFYLDANTRLWVTSSNPQFIVNGQYQMFFGAEFLP